MEGKGYQYTTNTEQCDQRNIVKITIHHCELKSENVLIQPVVCMHVVDSNYGSYVKKQDIGRAAMSFYENQRGDIDYIMPIMSQPCIVSGEKSHWLKWEESFILNESLEHLLKKEFKTIFFFEVIDLIPVSFTKHRYERLNENGMQKKAWAFLKVLGSNSILNTGRMLRLQLYKPYVSRKKKESGKIEVFHWWTKKAKVPLQASLYVSLEQHGEFTIEPALRSMLPQQEETGSSGEQLSGILKEPKSVLQDSSVSTPSKSKRNEVIWSRKKHEACKIPTQFYGTLDSSNGCKILKFSSTGRSLAAACELSRQFYLCFYEIPSTKLMEKNLAHSDVIYDLDWSQDDRNILTASADCSVKLWSIKPWNLLSSFVHPTYVYSAKFQPFSNNILVTACYDHVIRAWTSNKSVQMLQELEGHSSAVNTLCWHVKGLKLFSADNNGEIKLWKILQHPKDVMKNFDCYVFEKNINISELKGTSVDKIILDSCRGILFIFSGDGNVRLMDIDMESILFCYKSISKSQSILKGCCSPCANLLFVCNDDGKISVWTSVPSNTAMSLLNTIHSGQLTSIDYHPFEHMLAVSALEETESACLYTFDNLVQSFKTTELKSIERNPNVSTFNMNESIRTMPKSNYEDLNRTCSNSSKLSKSHMYHDDDSVDEGLPKLPVEKCFIDDCLSDSETSVPEKSKQQLMGRKKTESLTAIITKSGQLDVIAIAGSCTESDNHTSISQSSKGIQLDVAKKHSKRSLRRKKLMEGNTFKNDLFL